MYGLTEVGSKTFNERFEHVNTDNLKQDTCPFSLQFAPPVKNTSSFLVKLNKQINNPI